MQNKIKLIITARDPASANDIAQILPYFINHDRFVVRVIAQEPAYSILLNGKTDSNNFVIDFIGSIDDTSHECIKNTLKEVFLIFQPDYLLTGISGPDYGIDEIALSICSIYSGMKSFSIQSYWGDLNQSCGVLADTVFVLDEFASKITKQRHVGCKTVITGSLKLDYYNNINIIKERSAFRLKYTSENDASIISLFGQPLFEYEWYQTTLELFFEVASKIIPHVRIIYKPHPKETNESVNWVSNKLRESTIKYSIARDIDTLSVLAGTDVAVSLFSTIGYDLQNLLVRSEIAFSVSMYLFFNEDCKRWYQKYCMFEKIPMAEYGMSIVVEHSEELQRELQSALSNVRKKQCHTAILSHFPCNGVGMGAPSIVSEMLISIPNTS